MKKFKKVRIYRVEYAFEETYYEHHFHDFTNSQKAFRYYMTIVNTFDCDLSFLRLYHFDSNVEV